MKNPWIIPVTALVIGAAGGYISGKSTQASSAHSSAETSASSSRSSAPRSSSASAETSKKSRANVSAEQIARMPGNSTRVQALMDFYSGLSAEQLAEAATKLDSLPMGERMLSSFLLFGRWAEIDPTAAMAFSGTMGMAGGFVRPTILQSWASVDPVNAARYYQTNPREFAMMDMMGGRGPMGGQGASSIIATEWARQDPAAAMTWANSLTSGKNEAMSAVVGEVAKTDPRKAVEMLAKMSSEERAGAFESVAARYGALDFAEAQVWVKSLPANEQAKALASAIGGLSGTDPFAAMKEVTNMPDGETKDDLVPDIVRDLARKDPQSAADFVKSQTSEQAQRNSMRRLMPALVSKNPVAAMAFVNSYEAGPVRDSAAQSYVWSNNKGDPLEIIQVAESMTDKDDRDRTVGVAASRWMREDATAAKAYVEASTTLSDEAKKRITEGRSMWGGPRGGRGGD